MPTRSLFACREYNPETLRIEREIAEAQKTCQHLNTGKETIPNGEDVKWLTVCKDCLKVLSIE